ncbi:hypothetical protein O181_076309 [Austropuccinia psidii MF-1]|uniref:Uncharacterized protein n=1 Tax=Austropuccinia psidii MF-1 TaxID=1389203 RepID=A0A9Q3FC95_9BASI|nr:hypothetical protein [Austropuccinia psidii MF-1]
MRFDEAKFPFLCASGNVKYFPISLLSQSSKAIAVDSTSNNESLTDERSPMQTGMVDESHPVPASAVVDEIHTDVPTESGKKTSEISRMKIIVPNILPSYCLT